MSRVISPDILPIAAAVLAPRQGLVAVLSVTDTVALFAIPSWMAGKFAIFTMDGADADFLFGASDVVVVYGQASAVDGTTKAITPNVGSGGHLVNKVPQRRFVPSADSGHTHLSVDCVGSGSGKLYIEVSSS
jgi:hypothetical protein